MKNEVNRALAAEKKQYIIPVTTPVSFRTDYICQAAVGSVQGNTGLEFSEIDGDPI